MSPRQSLLALFLLVAFSLSITYFLSEGAPPPKLLIPNGYPDAGADSTITPNTRADSKQKELTCALQALYPGRDQEDLALYAKTHLELGIRSKISPWLLAAIAMNESQHRWYAIGPAYEVGTYQLLWKRSSPSREKLLANRGALAASLAIRELGGWWDYHQKTCRGVYRNNHPWWAHYNWGGRVFLKGRHAGYPTRVLGYLSQLEAAAKICRTQ